MGNATLVTLNPDQSSVVIPIDIINDTIVEGDEQFLGALNIPVDPPDGLRSSTTAATTTINILDDESKCSHDSLLHKIIVSL